MSGTEWPEELVWLTILGNGLEDAKKERIRTNNRVARANTSFDPFVGEALREHASANEEHYAKMLVDAYKRYVPKEVRAWAKTVPGLASGTTFPRILGYLGNPRIATPWRMDEDKNLIADGDPYARSLRQLWAYCGVGDPDRRPVKGMTQPELLAMGKRNSIRPVLFTWSTGLVKMCSASKTTGLPLSQSAADSVFWKIFTEAKIDGLTKVHERECRNTIRPRGGKPAGSNGCGTSAHPEWGAVGSPWRPGHAQAHAHRVAAKELLRQLWLVSG